MLGIKVHWMVNDFQSLLLGAATIGAPSAPSYKNRRAVTVRFPTGTTTIAVSHKFPIWAQLQPRGLMLSLPQAFTLSIHVADDVHDYPGGLLTRGKSSRQALPRNKSWGGMNHIWSHWCLGQQGKELHWACGEGAAVHLQ